MNKKISLQDLAQGLAKSKKMTRRDAESFIHKVFEVIEERVMADGTVKVKGLGTFKVNTVDSRESVNVATGERFVIDTHSRISFTPHPKLRDAVNRPFSDFETVVISDEVKTEDMEYIPQTDTPVEDTPVLVEAASESAVDETEPIAEDEPSVGAAPLVAEEPTLTEEAPEPVAVEPAVEPEPAPEPAPAPAPVAEPSAVEQPVPKVTAPTAHSKSSSRTGIIVGVLCLVVLCILFFVFWHPSQATEGAEATEVVEQTVEVQVEATSDGAAATEAQPAATPVVELTDEEAAEKYPQVENGEYLIVGTKEEYTLQKGDDLFKLSVGVYGDKKFAPYIIVYNDIKDPSHIEIGDVLKLPELRKKE